MPRSKRVDVLMKGFGKRLRAARITTGYESAEGLAKELGLGPARYRKYERGESFPPLDIMEEIEQRTEADLNWLILGKIRKA